MGAPFIQAPALKTRDGIPLRVFRAPDVLFRGGVTAMPTTSSLLVQKQKSMEDIHQMTSKSKSQLLALSLVCGALLLTSRAAMAQVEFVGVNAKATLTDNNTVATVTGSIVCGPSDTFQINSVIQQNHAGTNVAGSGNTESVACTGSPQPFAVQVQVVNPPNATFQKGPASAIVSAFTSPSGDSQTLTVKLLLSQ